MFTEQIHRCLDSCILYLALLILFHSFSICYSMYFSLERDRAICCAPICCFFFFLWIYDPSPIVFNSKSNSLLSSLYCTFYSFQRQIVLICDHRLASSQLILSFLVFCLFSFSPHNAKMFVMMLLMIQIQKRTFVVRAQNIY